MRQTTHQSALSLCFACRNGYRVLEHLFNNLFFPLLVFLQIVKEGYVDHTQFDSKDPHFDKSSSKEDPKWIMVDVKYVRKLKRFISLKELKQIHLEHKTNGGPLEKLSLFTRARLSVQPLTEGELNYNVIWGVVLGSCEYQVYL